MNSCASPASEDDADVGEEVDIAMSTNDSRIFLVLRAVVGSGLKVAEAEIWLERSDRILDKAEHYP